MKRLIKRNELTKEQAQKRISAQIPIDEKKKYKNVVVVDNSEFINKKTLNDLVTLEKRSIIFSVIIWVIFVIPAGSLWLVLSLWPI